MSCVVCGLLEPGAGGERLQQPEEADRKRQALRSASCCRSQCFQVRDYACMKFIYYNM